MTLKLKTALVSALCPLAGALAQEACYELPAALRYLSTIERPDPQPVCTFTTRNPMNDGACLWAPVGATVMYRDASTGAPTGWVWDTEGADPANPYAQDCLITYDFAGTWSFPTLTTAYGDMASEYAPDWKIKTGGYAELCHADCREWIETYALGVNYYDNEGGAQLGSLGGTNKLDIAGVGSFFMMAAENGYLEGVNIYLPKKPTKWNEGSQLRVRVWLCNLTQEDVEFTYLPLEGDLIKLEDIQTAEDGRWVPVKGGAVLTMKCASPLELFGKPFLFIDIDGFGDDPETEDFQILMDVMPNKVMQPEHAQDKLAHNSFVRLKSETDYMRPVSYFGGNYGSFMICPVVRDADTAAEEWWASGVKTAACEPSALQVQQSGDRLQVWGAEGRYDIHDASGRTVATGVLSGTPAEINTDGLGHGLYILATPEGTAKFLKK